MRTVVVCRFAFTAAHAVLLADTLGVKLLPASGRKRGDRVSRRPGAAEERNRSAGQECGAECVGEKRKAKHAAMPPSAASACAHSGYATAALPTSGAAGAPAQTLSAPTLSLALASAAASAGNPMPEAPATSSQLQASAVVAAAAPGALSVTATAAAGDAAAETSVQRSRDVADALRRMKAAVPGSPQCLCASPLLDPLLYVYDDKFVGPAIRARPTSEHPLKFYVRARPDRVAFKLDATGGEAQLAERGARRTCLHLFHPVLPLVLSVSQGSGLPTHAALHTWPLDG